MIEVLIHVFTIAFLPAVQHKHTHSNCWSTVGLPLCAVHRGFLLCQRWLKFILINRSTIMLRFELDAI